MERRARERPKRLESHTFAGQRKRLKGKARECQKPCQRAFGGAKARACHVCQARHAKVHASSRVLAGEGGRTRATTRRQFLLRRREPEPAQTLARACIDVIIGLEFAMM